MQMSYICTKITVQGNGFFHDFAFEILCPGPRLLVFSFLKASGTENESSSSALNLVRKLQKHLSHQKTSRLVRMSCFLVVVRSSSNSKSVESRVSS
jgi:hypothetical protein